MPIGDNIFLGREPIKKLFGFLPVIDRAHMAKVAQETMHKLDFHVIRLDAPVSAFSGGQRQAVAIGRAMYWNARLVIMDEPTAALGVPEQRKVMALIQSLKAQGKGIVFISHISATFSKWPTGSWSSAAARKSVSADRRKRLATRSSA